MKCAFHPDREAKTRCVKCKKATCDECAIPARGKGFICSRCAALEAAQEVTQGAFERRDERDEQKLAQEAKKRKKRYNRYIAIGVFALVVIAVNIVLYLKTPVEEEDRFIPSEQPVATTIIINEAVQDYAKDHEGKVPETLIDLTGKYIPSKDLSAADVEKFHYVKTSPSSYELGVGKFGGESDSDLIFTEEGLK